MITRRHFLGGIGVGLGAIALPSWFTLPEPVTPIQKYFGFLTYDGKTLHQIPTYDCYEVISYIYCAVREKPVPPKLEGLKYYYGRAEISGPTLAQTKAFPEYREKASLDLQKRIVKVRKEMEVIIKKELGNRNIWVFDSKPPNELILLKRI